MTNNCPALIFVVRHGETEWNLIGKQQGHDDSPLTERGIQQANALAEGLVGRGIEFVYSSDLGRAMKTAEIIGSKLELPVHTDKRLRERHLGSLQGFTKDEFQCRYPDEWTKFYSGDPDYCFPEGESARQRYKRTVCCIEDIANLHLEQTILIVAHGGVLNGLFYRAIGIPLSEPRRFSLFNAAINSFSVCGDSWQLDTWGEIAHLKGIETLDDN
jgi:2,3-bisphosphoglycerate-dependent phosphoglycerate mutase